MRYSREYSLRANLQASPRPTNMATAYVSEPGREGVFNFTTASKATEVAADIGQAVYIAPASDPSGASGAWVRSDVNSLNVKWFGATGNGVADDTTAVQRAINTAAALDIQTVFFPQGIFLVTNLTVPTLGNTASGFKVLELRGVSPPSTTFGTISSIPLSQKGSIIKSTAATGAAFRVPPTGGTFSYYHLVLRNLTFRTYDNPTITAVDCEYVQQLTMRSVVIDTGVYSVAATNPTTTTSHGLKTPRVDNGALVDLDSVVVSGYYVGISIGEHFDGRSMVVVGCKYGLDFKGGYHANNINRVGLYRNTNNIRVSAATRFRITQANIEHPSNAGNWQYNVSDVYDPSNFGEGHIEYAVTAESVGWDSTFTKDGGTGINCVDIGA